MCEVREAGQEDAPRPPTSSEKAQRQVRADEEPVLGWRPAVGQVVPNTQWVLEKKLGEGGGRSPGGAVVVRTTGPDPARSPHAAASAQPPPKFYISFDGTGVPVRKSELVGRRGKQADGSARTREVKLGCVFTQVGLDKEGHPQRDPDSTTYVGAIESSTLFGWRMYAEALRRGLEQAQTVIVLTDGATL